MQEKENKKSLTDVYGKLSKITGIAAIICAVFMINISGVPVSVLLGIFGFTFGIVAKDGQQVSKDRKGGMILSIIAIVMGVIEYMIMYSAIRIMTDPKLSKELQEYMREIVPNLPESLRELFNGYY